MKSIKESIWMLFLVIMILAFTCHSALSIQDGDLVYRKSIDKNHPENGSHWCGEENFPLTLGNLLHYCGHVGVYIKEDDEGQKNRIIEAIFFDPNFLDDLFVDEIINTPYSEFCPKDEKFMGVKTWKDDVSENQRDTMRSLALDAVAMKLGFDINFDDQKGPGKGDFTCVGFAEKIWESANSNIFIYGNEYPSPIVTQTAGIITYEDESNYAFNITPGKFEYHVELLPINSYVSEYAEFSQVLTSSLGREFWVKYYGLYYPACYIFWPYTQFVQPTLVDATTLEITSVSDGQVDLKWLAPPNRSSLDHYEIRYGTSSGEYIYIDTCWDNTSETIYYSVTNDLINGIIYYFLVVPVFADDQEGVKTNEVNACPSPLPQAPTLSNPKVAPPAGTESTNFEFLVDYYDPDNEIPLEDYRHLVFIDGHTEKMTLKSGTEANGTYQYTTTLSEGNNYRYSFSFADTAGKIAIKSWQGWLDGPIVGPEGDTAVNVVIQCTRISSDFWLKYSLTSASGPWTDIPITGQILTPIFVPRGSCMWWQAGVSNPNFEYREWELVHMGTVLGGNILPHFDFALNPDHDEVGLNIYYRYSPQKYTISGTIKKNDGALIPGGIDLVLESVEQDMSIHTDNGAWQFLEVSGGVTVTITPSNNDEYTLSPAHLVFRDLDGDKTNRPIIGYYTDDYVPEVAFTNVPAKICESISVEFSWAGQDNKSMAGNLMYQYQLEGVDETWASWQAATTKEYILENGAYIFNVTAKDEVGHVNQAPERYAFVVNAAPLFMSATQNNRSVWSTRIVLKMPTGIPSGHRFILLPEHAGFSCADLVPVYLHWADDEAPIGANEIIAAKAGLPPQITKATTGWLVTLPQNMNAGESLEVDIIWGKVVYFGWQEFVSIPLGFPNGHNLPGNSCNFIVTASSLDENLRLWRIACKNNEYGVGYAGETKTWVFMNVYNAAGPIIDEKILRHEYGSPIDATGQYYSIYYGTGYILDAGNRISLQWIVQKVGNDGEDIYNFESYSSNYYNYDGSLINENDMPITDKSSYTFPKMLLNDRVWIVGDTKGADISDIYYQWFLVLDSFGNEIISRTNIDTIQNLNGSMFGQGIAAPIGGNILLLWDEGWVTDNSKERYRIKYQIRDNNGSLVKDTQVLTPLLHDSINRYDFYERFNNITDKEGKVWLSYRHRQTDQPYEYYYVVLGTDGNILYGPTLTPDERTFAYCDADGKIWASENGQFFALNPDNTLAVSPRTAEWIPSQDVGNIAAHVTASGYRLYDRWSPHFITIDIPTGANINSMKLFDLNLWDNDLHPANINLKEGTTSIWNQSGQFTGHTTINVAGSLNEGTQILTMTQDDFLGGQVLLTFPYFIDSDGDGVPNNQDTFPYNSNEWLDADGDNIGNNADLDDDNDMLPDVWEIAHGLNPSNTTGVDGKDGDFDNDGWSNHEEYVNGTNPSDDNSPVPTPPDVMEVKPHNDAGIEDSTRIPNNTSFAIRIEDADGIDITDTSSIMFTINDDVNDINNATYTRDLNDITAVRVIKLNEKEDTQATKLWAVYDRTKDTFGNYAYDTYINIMVDAKDRRGDWMPQTSYNFNIETETEHVNAISDAPDIVPVASNDPTLDDPDYINAVGLEVNSGALEGAKIIYNNSEAVQPTFGPTAELPPFDLADIDAVGVPMNLQPPTVFSNPVKIFIPCPGHTDINSLSIYLFNGVSWVQAADTTGMVPNSRINHQYTIPPTIEIKLYHFTGIQAGVISTAEILLSATVHYFGNVTVGSLSEVTFTITNEGSLDLNVTNISLSDDTNYSLEESTTAIIAPGAYSTVTVTFSPQSAGAHDATLTIESDDPDEPSIIITLNGSGTNNATTSEEIGGGSGGGGCFITRIAINFI